MRKTLTFIIVMLIPSYAFGWEISPYGAPTLSHDAGSVSLQVLGAPGGVLYRETALDPSKVYALTVQGHGDPMTMRMDRGQGLEYLAAPQGEQRLVVDDAASVDVLLYADAPMSYVIESVDLQECPQCLTAKGLKRLILADVPELETAEGLRKAEMLLAWAANATDFSLDLATYNGLTEGMAPETVYADVYLPNAGGVYCGGAAVFYKNILALFDVDAFTVNFGIPDTMLTHVSVVVPHDDKYFLMDPTFAATYRRGDDIVSLNEVITVPDDIAFVELGLHGRDFLFVDPAHQLICEKPLEKVGVFPACSIGDRSYADIYLMGWSEALAAVGLPVGWQTLPALMQRGFFDVGYAGDPGVRERFIDLLRAQEIPLYWEQP